MLVANKNSVIRVQSLLNLGMFSNYRIHQVLQKYAPPYIKFVGQWVEGVDWEIDTSCDLYLLHISSPNPDSYRPFFGIGWIGGRS